MNNLNPRLQLLMRDLRTAVLANPPVSAEVRSKVRGMLEYLASPEGRTDINCRAVDLTLMNDEEIWAHIEKLDAVDDVVADVLRDMSNALHDSIQAADVARNFDSTPEQLLNRLR